MKKIIALCCLIFLTPTLFAATSTFKEGTHYISIKPTPPSEKGDKVELVEFFWYGCPHCYRFEPILENWLEKGKPENVTFQSIPVIFPNNKTTTLHAKMFYALTFMNEIDRIHPIIFKALHKDRIRLRSFKKIKEFLVSNGVDGDKFEKVINSFAVQSKVQRSNFLAQRYGITGVPTLVLDQRYRSGGGMKSYEQMLELIVYLNQQVLSQRKAESQAKEAASNLYLNQSKAVQPKPLLVAGGMDILSHLNQMGKSKGDTTDKPVTDIENTPNDATTASGGMIEQVKSGVVNQSTGTAKSLATKAADSVKTDNAMLNQIKTMGVDKVTEGTKAVTKKTVDKVEKETLNLLK